MPDGRRRLLNNKTRIRLLEKFLLQKFPPRKITVDFPKLYESFVTNEIAQGRREATTSYRRRRERRRATRTLGYVNTRSKNVLSLVWYRAMWFWPMENANIIPSLALTRYAYPRTAAAVREQRWKQIDKSEQRWDGSAVYHPAHYRSNHPSSPPSKVNTKELEKPNVNDVGRRARWRHTTASSILNHRLASP